MFKNNRKMALIGCGSFIGIFLLIVIGVATCASLSTHPSPTTTAYSGPEVEYEVTGTTTGVSITLGNAQGGTEQISKAYLPWKQDYDAFPARFLYLSAQNLLDNSGKVTVNIYYQGALVKTATSSGAYVIATASEYK